MQLVRRSVADVASVVARQSVPAGEWPELLDYLQQCGHSSNEGHREVALTLFTSLAESIGRFEGTKPANVKQPVKLIAPEASTGEHLQPAIPIMTLLVGKGLSDSSEQVCLEWRI